MLSLAFALAVTPVSCEELNRAWDTELHDDFHVAWKKEPFSCPSGVAQTAKALYDLKIGKLGYDYYGWAKRTVPRLEYDAKCTYYGYTSTDKIALCAKFFSSDDEARVGTIVHEAAHARAGDPSHVVCEHGKSKGERACDDRLYEDFAGSGYNFEFQYYRQASEANHPHLRAEVMRGWLKYDVLNKFNSVTEAQVKHWVTENPVPLPGVAAAEARVWDHVTIGARLDDTPDAHLPSARTASDVHTALALEGLAAAFTGGGHRETYLRLRGVLERLARTEADLYLARSAALALVRGAEDPQAVAAKIVAARAPEDRFAFSDL